MPTVTIKAFDAQYLPSPIQLQAWSDDWGANFGPPVINGATATYNVGGGLTVNQVENIVEPYLDAYNSNHPGNDSITYTVT